LTHQTPTEKPHRSSGWLSAVLFFGAVALVVAGIIWAYPQSSDEPEAVAETTTTSTTPEPVEVTAPTYDPGEEPIADAAQVILPSTVHIQTPTGVGSGVVYDSDGLIVTAAHVVEGQDIVRVRFADGDQVEGTVIGRAEQVDIAVIEVARTGLTAATFASDKPRVGQTAIAVGSPWGLESTVTAGIISAVDQTNCGFGSCSSMVQTDAAINPGNSGGALVDRNGHVVGINVSIFSTSGSNDGVGFAVPADIAVDYAGAIISGEPIETALLGVTGDNVDTEGQAGAVISEVTTGTGAAEAGLQADDVVIGFDGVPINGIGDLQAQVRAHQPGETVEIIVLRDGTELKLTVTLGTLTEDVN
jgi:S1-C subfamily serine protease